MKKLVSILLVCLLLCTAVPFCGFAADDAMKVVVSLEGFTLGKGYFVEPTAYTVSQINDLVKKDGYGPYTEATLTAGMAVLAMLNDNSLSAVLYEGGTWTNGGSVNIVRNIDDGKVNFPAVVTANGGPSNSNYVKNTDKDLGGGDYAAWAGWMYTLNDEMPWDALCDNVLKNATTQNSYGNTYVIRMQFTLGTPDEGDVKGLDMNRILGYTGWDGSAPYFAHANKDKAMIAYAESTNNAAKKQAKPVLEKLDATQADVDATISALNAPEETAPSFWDRIVAFFQNILAFFKNLFKIG